MIHDYDRQDEATTFVQTANPTPTITFGWQADRIVDGSADEATTFVQTANPTPTITFGWSH
ncbi:hypothetical protein ACMHYB_38700 [Sorangium sp. So ce1128]